MKHLALVSPKDNYVCTIAYTALNENRYYKGEWWLYQNGVLITILRGRYDKECDKFILDY